VFGLIVGVAAGEAFQFVAGSLPLISGRCVGLRDEQLFRCATHDILYTVSRDDLPPGWPRLLNSLALTINRVPCPSRSVIQPTHSVLETHSA